MNNLTFIKNVGVNKYGQRKALYRCICGSEKEILINSVKTGNTSSCGCIHKKGLIERSTTHGMANHPLYGVYWGIYARCYNSNVASYKNYGARGVKICDEWVANPALFIKWAIENGWELGLEIDKDIKAKSKGVKGVLYSPQWCTIVTPKENGSAKRNNREIEFDEELATFSEFCDKYKIDRSVVNRRLKDGWSVEDAFKTPTIEIKSILFNGATKTISEWAADCNITPEGLRKRLKMHGIEKALTMPKMLNQFKRKPIEINYSFGHIN